MRTQIVLLADAMAHTQLPRPLRVTRYKPSPRCTCAQGGNYHRSPKQLQSSS